MASQIDICNRALLRMAGRSTISSINPPDGSQESYACAILYTPTYEMLARAAHWNIFRKQATLSLLKAAAGTPENQNGTTLSIPPTPWLYSYAYPDDCLLDRFLVPSATSSSVGNSPFANLGWTTSSIGNMPVHFGVAYDTDANNNPIRVILTNLDQAQCVYTVNQPNPVGWDSQFQEAMVSSLAVGLVPALTGNLQMMQLQMAAVESIVGNARRTDGDEGLTIMDHIPDFISVRGYVWLNGDNFVTPYGSLNWPTV